MLIIMERCFVKMEFINFQLVSFGFISHLIYFDSIINFLNPLLSITIL